ncbi:MAG TPA: 7-cyano-7-deazaguanine synthase QueC [Thermoplasmata archaeon]|nr:7-cyano-7-deazaguanine synthase QueC [Thermoplasmata archaeon]
MKPSAVILLSGGLDSATVLALAIRDGLSPIALTFRYGQRHGREVAAARAVARHFKVKVHIVHELDLRPIAKSALTSDEDVVPVGRSLKAISQGIPATYVPSRNIIMLSIASSLAESRGAHEVFIAAHAVDYSGYPDCRPEFFEAFEEALRKGTKTGVEGAPIRIRAPLLRMGKAEIIRLGSSLGVPFAKTWSCYLGGKRACGRCDSCILRLKGFAEAGSLDPALYAKQK